MQKIGRYIAYLNLAGWIALAGCGGSAGTGQPASDTASGYDGAWEYVQTNTPDGPNTGQSGQLVVHGEYVCHIRTDRERSPIDEHDPDQVRSEKAADLYSSVTAACGRFRSEGDLLTVTWLTSADPSIVSHSTEFIPTQEGDMLTLAPAASPQFSFVYKRLGAH